MSELINTRTGNKSFRRQLLTTASGFALLSAICGQAEANASDREADRPTVWIDLGVQLEQMSGKQEPFAPPFAANFPSNFFSPADIQKPLPHSFGGEGAVSFEPHGSDWVFSAAVRYGRSNATRQRHQQTPNAKVPVHFSTPYGKYHGGYSLYPSGHAKFSDVVAKQSESHFVLDFQAGKDVGLGMFGRQGTSVVSAGVRFAQFSSKANVNMRAEPDVNYPAAPLISIPARRAFYTYDIVHFHAYTGIANTERSFHGVGPMIAWSGSTPFMGTADTGEVSIDWGANAAVLFGRQKASGHHQTNTKSFYKQYFDPGFNKLDESAVRLGRFLTNSVAYHSAAGGHGRMRSVVVPNLGGFAGISVRYSDVKLSLGYRADFFFGAIDGGIDTRKTENVGFHGPFATVSIGLGG